MTLKAFAVCCLALIVGFAISSLVIVGGFVTGTYVAAKSSQPVFRSLPQTLDLTVKREMVCEYEKSAPPTMIAGLFDRR